MVYFGDILQMLRGQIFQSPCLPAVDMSGKTVIVTGANKGLGFMAAKQLYQLNVSHLILACRDTLKAEEAKKLIIRSSARSVGKIEIWQLDMADYSSVLGVGERMIALPNLDVVVANAGINVLEFEKFEDHESTLTVNVISTMVLAMLAIPKLQENPSIGRIIFTGSVVHIFANHHYLLSPSPGHLFESLDNKETADMADRYYLSKLILLLAYRQMASAIVSRSKDGHPSVILSYINPGWCRTELFKLNDGGLGGRIGLGLIGRSAEDGGKTLVHAAVADETSHGKYLSECRDKPVSRWVASQEGFRVEKELWQELKGNLEKIQAGIPRCVS